jgi:magnesium transporter
VARRFERNDWISAPVVDGNGQLLGRITIDDVVDVIMEEADHSLTSLAGLAEEGHFRFRLAVCAAPRRVAGCELGHCPAGLISDQSVSGHD